LAVPFCLAACPIWAGQFEERLGPQARRALKNLSNDLLVSAATAWEIATKVRLGKLPEAVALETNFMELMSEARFRVIPVTAQDALRAGRLRGDHRDPWDRMIAAQALFLDIPVISIDSKLELFGVRRIW
jgi:PIN domain nuclease of toxin-antitoxin system